MLLPCRHIISARLHKGLPLVQHTTIHRRWLKSYQIDFVTEDTGDSLYDENTGNHNEYDVLQEPPIQGTLNQAQKFKKKRC